MLQGRVVFTALFCFCWNLRITKYWQFANFHQNGCILKTVNNNRIMWNTYYLVIKLCCNKIGQNQYCALCKVFQNKSVFISSFLYIYIHKSLCYNQVRYFLGFQSNDWNPEELSLLCTDCNLFAIYNILCIWTIKIRVLLRLKFKRKRYKNIKIFDKKCECYEWFKIC